MALDPDVQAFAALLRELEALLRDCNELSWAKELALCAASVERSDAYGLLRFLSLFGGMGFLNDLVFVRDGKPLVAENRKFDALRSRSYEAAVRLKRDEMI
jgi:hypothetical protein